MSFKIQNEVDVIVFGAGPAGITAAITAAREGQKVTLIESKSVIGGVLASCPGMMLGAGYPCGRSVGGFFQELVDKLEQSNPPRARRISSALENFGAEVIYDPNYIMDIFYGMLEKEKVTLLLSCIAYDVIVEQDSIMGVKVATTQGSCTYKAKVYIDCTGDGNIAYLAGVPCKKGDNKGLMMGATLTFFMENVDTEKAFANLEDPYFTVYAEKGIKEGRIHPTIPQIYMLEGFREGSVFFNTVTVTGVDGTCTSDVLKGTNIARKRVFELADFCKQEIPGFENSFISNIGPLVGVRETRRIEGKYELNYHDIAKATKFPDGIVACDNPYDEVFRDNSVKEYSHEAALEQGEFYTIPLSSLMPKKIDNLLFAGRNMSVDLKGFASVRGMPQCMGMGQAVGVLAAMAASSNKKVQDVKHTNVVQHLVELGVILS